MRIWEPTVLRLTHTPNQGIIKEMFSPQRLAFWGWLPMNLGLYLVTGNAHSGVPWSLSSLPDSITSLMLQNFEPINSHCLHKTIVYLLKHPGNRHSINIWVIHLKIGLTRTFAALTESWLHNTYIFKFYFIIFRHVF